MGVNVQRSLHPQYHDKAPLSKVPNPELLPGRRSLKWLPTDPGVCSRCVCVFTAVCVHLGWVNAEHEFCKKEYGSPYLAVCHVTMSLCHNKISVLL